MQSSNLGSKSKKIRKNADKHHKNMFTPSQEAEIARILEAELTKHRPNNIDPLSKIVTNFCIRKGIKLKGQGLVSEKRVYALLNKYKVLTRLYWPERVVEEETEVSTSNEDSEGISSCTYSYQPSSPATNYSELFAQYIELKKNYHLMERKVNDLEQRLNSLYGILATLQNTGNSVNTFLPGFHSPNCNQHFDGSVFSTSNDYESFEDESFKTGIYMSDKEY